MPGQSVAQELHEHQGLINVAHAHALGDGVAQALVGGGRGWRHGGILAGIPCAGRLAGARCDGGWNWLVERPSPAGYDDPGLLATWAVRHLPRAW